MQKFAAVAFSLALSAAMAGCAGTSSNGLSSSSLTPAMPFEIAFTLPKHTIGEELPSEGVGSKKDPTWGTVGGFTQTGKAQVLAFPPGTVVTIRNLSKSIPHTLDVFAKAGAPPAKWPANPNLPFSKHGGGKLTVGYASGSLNPGASVQVELVKAGTYLIGCAYHYVSNHMRDVLVVKAGATPGPDFQR
jgi:hypothetical protein